MTVLINNRGVIHRQSHGCVTTSSVNYTGPNLTPVPYVNLAYSRDAVNLSSTVCVENQRVCHEKSYFSKSVGDEAGDGGGVISGTINGRAEFVSSSPNVRFDNFAAVKNGDLMVSNCRNTPPSPLVQTDPIVMLSKLIRAKDHDSMEKEKLPYECRWRVNTPA